MSCAITTFAHCSPKFYLFLNLYEPLIHDKWRDNERTVQCVVNYKFRIWVTFQCTCTCTCTSTWNAWKLNWVSTIVCSNTLIHRQHGWTESFIKLRVQYIIYYISYYTIVFQLQEYPPCFMIDREVLHGKNCTGKLAIPTALSKGAVVW